MTNASVSEPSISAAWRERHDKLKAALVERATRDIDQGLCFDNMEIARAMVAAAFKRLEIEDVEMRISYSRHLQKVKEEWLVSKAAFKREIGLQIEAEENEKRAGQ